MKSAYFAVSALLYAAAVAAEEEPKHFINWDIIEHPIVESFKWQRPFPDDDTPPMGFETKCDVHIKLHAKQYKFREFDEHLKPWAATLREFYDRRPYQGHWDGVNEGGDNRDIIMMEWREVPRLVRDWIEKQQSLGKDQDNRWTYVVLPRPKHTGDTVSASDIIRAPRAASAGEPASSATPAPKVKDKDKVLFFQAGATYDILPLWVAHKSKCESKWPPDKTQPCFSSAALELT